MHFDTLFQLSVFEIYHLWANLRRELYLKRIDVGKNVSYGQVGCLTLGAYGACDHIRLPYEMARVLVCDPKIDFTRSF